ncbi:hypothetical protein AMATHDRAFT_65743 [Amanita thiersii Skay4041]|uniref:CENP-V/GFA domain-containing protein n=1 Tax=Amanita thiersii Skay4041 TaxID=703135 RepID=A0A2A9NG83_9AGAR|nr:hypothetical protein AMATHDRAFT_65743 [Amanita thiersii Skay4041]
MDRPPYSFDPSHQPFKPIYTGSCSCGQVQFQISRERPLDTKFCHCRTCQKLHGAPFQWAAIFEKSDVLFTKGTDSLAFWSSDRNSQEHSLPCKVSCNNCRSPIMDEGRNMLLLFPTLIDFPKGQEEEARRKFYPSSHIFYSSRSIDVQDGLPKYDKHKGQSALVPEMRTDKSQ